MANKADYGRARELYPTVKELGYDEWRDFFDTAAGFAAMGQLLYDIYDEVLALRERDAGRKTMGRRPSRTLVPLDQVLDVVFPKPHTLDPFPVAMEKLLASTSQRVFAKRIPCDQATLSRLLSGQLLPDLSMLERIAEAARVQPSFFVEWRALWLGRMITRVMLEKPHMSITAMQTLTKTKQKAMG